MAQIDDAIIITYLSALFIWGIYIGIKETADDYLVFSRKAPLPLLVFSIISTWVGVGTTIATAASSYEIGISLGVTAMAGGIIGITIAAWFAPRLKQFGDKYDAHTIGDFLQFRYSSSCAIVAGFLILIIYLLLTAAQFLGLTALLAVWTGVSFEVLVWYAAISTIIYTAFAGIKSDFFTDGIHFFIMTIVIFLVLLPITISKTTPLGGINSLPSSFFNPIEYGGISFLIAGIIFGGGSVFVTMELWQRIYAATSARHAKIALLISAIAIISFYLVSTFLGLAMRVLNPGIARSDQVLFILMRDTLPAGVLGFGIAGFMAIVISTINSTIMVASSSLTKNIILHIPRVKKSEKQLLLFSRLATFLCGFISLVIAHYYPNIIALSVNSMFFLLILLPSILGGFFWERSTAQGALYSMLLGLTTIVVTMLLGVKNAFVFAFLISCLSFISVSLFTGKSSNINSIKV